MWGVAVEGFNVKHAKCLVDIVGSHRCSPSMAHKPGGFLVFVSVTIIPGYLACLPLLPPLLDVSCTRHRLREQKPRRPANL